MNLERKKLRLQSWDYSENGWYFVTICTTKKINWFGRVENDEMKLSEVGKVVKKCWEEIPRHFEAVELDYFVIMPNHIHGIVIIERDVPVTQTSSTPVGYRHACTLQSRNNQLLPIIIGSFKSACSKNIRTEYKQFSWQRSFYDHIITTHKDLSNTREYITNNPMKWQFYSENTNGFWK